MKNFFIGSAWQTTIAGYLGAIAVAVLPIMQSGHPTENTVLTAIVIAVLGRLAAYAQPNKSVPPTQGGTT